MGDINDPTAKKRKRLSDRERVARMRCTETCARFLGGCAEVHWNRHIEALEDGGKDEPTNRIPLCKATTAFEARGN